MLQRFGLILPLLVGCGHAAHHHEPDTTASAGQDSATDGGQAGATATTGGAAGSVGGARSNAAGASGGEAGGATQATTMAGAANAEGGGSGAPDDSPFLAGTRYCASEEDCAGFDCIGFASTANGTSRICSSACQSNAGCDLGELCVGVGDLPPLCLQPCQSAEDCSYAFDCVHYQDIATFCLPAPWTEHFMHPMP